MRSPPSRMPRTSGCCLEQLEQVVGRGRRVGVVEIDHEADADEVLAGALVAHRVDPAATDLAVAGRSFSGHGPIVWITRSSGRGTFQTSLTPSSQTCGSRSLGEVELADRGAGQMPPAALGEHRRLRARCRCRARSSTAARRRDRAPCRRSARRRRARRSTISCVAAVSVSTYAPASSARCLLVAGERGDRDHLGAVVAKRRRRRDPQLGARGWAAGRRPPW